MKWWLWGSLVLMGLVLLPYLAGWFAMLWKDRLRWQATLWPKRDSLSMADIDAKLAAFERPRWPGHQTSGESYAAILVSQQQMSLYEALTGLGYTIPHQSLAGQQQGSRVGVLGGLGQAIPHGIGGQRGYARNSGILGGLGQGIPQTDLFGQLLGL